MTVAADPRLRERKAAVARAAGHRRLVALSGAFCAVAVVVSALVVLHSSLLAARVVHVGGAAHETRAQILAVTGLGAHPPLADVDTGADAAALERLPWVRTARVVDDWPDGVTVTITERRPVAYVSLSGKNAALVDATGRVLGRAAAIPAGLVKLSGAGPVGAPGSRLAKAAPALAVAAQLPTGLAPRVASLGVGRDGVTLHLAGGPIVVLGRDRAIRAKIVALNTVLAKVPLHGTVMINLRVPSEPVLTR